MHKVQVDVPSKERRSLIPSCILTARQSQMVPLQAVQGPLQKHKAAQRHRALAVALLHHCSRLMFVHQKS